MAETGKETATHDFEQLLLAYPFLYHSGHLTVKNVIYPKSFVSTTHTSKKEVYV